MESCEDSIYIHFNNCQGEGGYLFITCTYDHTYIYDTKHIADHLPKHIQMCAVSVHVYVNSINNYLSANSTHIRSKSLEKEPITSYKILH